MLANITTVTKGHKEKNIVRITIPHDIAKELKLQPGDVLNWTIEERKGRRVMVVRKVEL